MILKRMRICISEDHITNCYIVVDENSKEAMVVDPGAEPERIIEMLQVLDAKLKYIVLTHCHADHIGGVYGLKEALGGDILSHRVEAENLKKTDVNLTDRIGREQIWLEVDSRLDDGDIIHVGEIEFKIIHTPGHTSGGICLYCETENMLISGDTLFRGTWGRTDLPTGNMDDIMKSITNKLLILPEDTIIYPGHGKPSKISEEEPIYFNLQPRKL